MEHRIIKKIFTILVLFAIAGFSLTSCYYDNEEDLYPNISCDTLNVSFSEDILPLLSNQCLACHQPPIPSGGVDLSTYQEIKNVADNGRLYSAINHESGFSAMPQGSDKWNTCDLTKVRIWINKGSLNN